MRSNAVTKLFLVLGIVFSCGLLFTAYSQERKDIPPDIKIPLAADTLSNPLKIDKTTLRKGARLYQKLCWTCHGDYGFGDGPQASEIETKVLSFKDSIVIERTDGALYWWIYNGGPDMKGYKETINNTDIWRLVAFTRYLQNR